MSTDAAVLDAPVEDAAPPAAEAAPNTAKPSGEATPASERNGQAEKREERARVKADHAARRKARETGNQPRDPETQRFASDKPKEEAKPAEAAAKQVAPAIDDATFARAEAVGLTRYAASKLGDKLAAEVTRREQAAAAKATEQARAPAQPEPKQEAALPTAAAAKAEEDRLTKLGDLGEEYGDLSPRDKVYREELAALREELRQLRPLRDDLDGIKKRAQQDEEARKLELLRKDASEVDAFVADLGEEFAPIFGKGDADSVPDAYFAARNEVYVAASAVRQAVPAIAGLPLKDVLRGIAGLIYPNEINQLTERKLFARAQEAAKTRGAPASSTVIQTPTGYAGPSKGDPVIKEKARQIKLRNQGLA